MAFSDITPGDKIGRALGARFIESKKGTPALEVSFEFTEPSTGGPERLSRQFWLSQDAIDRSMETLVDVLEYNGSEVTDQNGVLTDPNALNFKKEVKLVVEFEQGRDADGNPTDKSYPKIKWVNNASGGSQFAGVKVETVKSTLAAVGFKAAFLSAKKNSGSPRVAPPKASDFGPEPKFNTDEEIPF